MLKKIKLFYQSLVFVFLAISCSQYGTITNSTTIVRFPIAIDLLKIDKNATIVKRTDSDEIHHIELKGIDKILINDLSIDGNFEIYLYADKSWCTILDSENYKFYSVTIKILSNNFMEIFSDIIYQPLPLMPIVTCDATIYIDLKNKIRYMIQNSKDYITIEDVGAYFEENITTSTYLYEED